MEKHKAKAIRVPFADEVDNISTQTGIPRAVLLERAWKYYKLSSDYAKLILFSKGE